MTRREAGQRDLIDLLLADYQRPEYLIGYNVSQSAHDAEVVAGGGPALAGSVAAMMRWISAS